MTPADETRILALKAGLLDAVGHPMFLEFLDNMPVGVYIVTADGTPVHVNRIATELLGPALGPASSIHDPVGPFSMFRTSTGIPCPAGELPIVQALEGADAHSDDIEVRRPGRTIPLEVWASPVRDRHGAITHAMSVFTDISERREIEERVRFQSQLLAAAGQAILALSPAGTVLYWNAAATELYGWEAEEVLGRDITGSLAASERELDPMRAALRAGGRWSGEFSAKRRNGEAFPALVTTTPMFDGDGALVALIGVSVDITDRKVAEESRAFLSAMVEGSDDAIIGATTDGIILSWNAGAERIFGFTSEEAIGQHITLMAPPERVAEVGQIRQQALVGRPVAHFETTRMTKSGDVIDVSLTTSPVRGPSGDIIGICAITHDITDRLRLAREAQAHQVRRLAAERLAERRAFEANAAEQASLAKSEFLSRMSHELRTPLNAVLGFGQILMMDDLTAEQRENLEFMLSAGEHLLDLINDVLDISHVEADALPLSLEQVHLSDVVAHAITLIGGQAALYDISLRANTDDADFYVVADRRRLLQILLNLLSNAVKFNRPGGTIEISCESSGGTASIAVTDTGLGISDADSRKLFTPFERLTANATTIGGSGVGLALSRVLSQQMGGSLTVSSTVGSGSTFVLELPAGHPPDRPGPPDADDAAPTSDVTPQPLT